MEPILWLLAGIALLAFTLKATTGFGPSIVFIALGSLLIEPKTLVPASSLLDLLAGGLLLRIDTEGRTLRYWLPLGVSISVGAVVGALFLDAVPAETFRTVLGWFVLGLGVWFVLGIGGGGREEHLPAKASRLDHAMTLLGGMFGGLAGISGPPIIWQFGRQYAKRAFRQVLVPIFFAAAVVRTIAYAGTGLV
ncbi:MAG: sulfite exporter TauE/SafE family protein, partial [Bacteroidota bacterium]